MLEVPLEVAPRQVVRPLATPVAGPDTPPAVDCLGLSPGPRSVTELGRPRGYHDLAFSDDGEIIGSDGSALVAVDRQDNLRVYAPVSGAEGIDRLADGTLIVASSEGLVKVSPEGAVVPLAPGVQAYGVTVGPDGLVYAGTNGVLYRVDPSSGSVDTYLDPQTLPEPFAARTINFDVEHSLMYIGSFGDTVYVLPIDAQLNPAGSPRRFASVQGGGPYFDGLGVDACGNLYVPSYTHSALYRFGPDGEGENRDRYAAAVDASSDLLLVFEPFLRVPEQGVPPARAALDEVLARWLTLTDPAALGDYTACTQSNDYCDSPWLELARRSPTTPVLSCTVGPAPRRSHVPAAPLVPLVVVAVVGVMRRRARRSLLSEAV